MATYRIEVHTNNGQKLNSDEIELDDRNAMAAYSALEEQLTEGKPIKVTKNNVIAFVPAPSVAFVAVVQLPDNAGA